MHTDIDKNMTVTGKRNENAEVYSAFAEKCKELLFRLFLKK